MQHSTVKAKELLIFLSLQGPHSSLNLLAGIVSRSILQERDRRASTKKRSSRMIRRGHPKRQSNQNRISNGSRIARLLWDNPVNQAAYWSQDTFILKNLTEQFPLPQVVRCTNKLVPGEEQHLSVNIHAPILLCSGRTVKKLLAKHVSNEFYSQKLIESDDRIIIPDDYEGNFVRLQARTTKDLSVVRSLADVAKSQSPAFMTLSPVTSFTSDPDNVKDIDPGSSVVSSKLSRVSGKSQSGPLKRLVHQPGSVFVVSGTTKGIVKGKKQKARDVLLMKCSDVNGGQVLIPSDQPGDVFEVEQPLNGNGKLSVGPADLMSTNRYPSLVRFVYGHHAPRLTPCSNLFTLIDTFEENTLVGCLLYPGHALLIEIPLNSSLTFQVAVNRDDIMAMKLPRHALSVIEERKESFMRDLKLKCKFLHRVSPATGHSGHEYDDDMPSATVRMRQYVNEACLYL